MKSPLHLLCEFIPGVLLPGLLLAGCGKSDSPSGDGGEKQRIVGK
ncbi:MAG TPA: hypothetical protein VFZ59_14310 [Verrucomicrobiae bacterium]|nr:hypothetical protein [Verrucomicrobiae bacterium]